MLANLLIGIAVMVPCIVILAGVLSMMLKYLYRLEQKSALAVSVRGGALVLTCVLMILLAGILLQIGIWAAVFVALDEFADLATAFYHSTVNFTTLGYGDIVLSERRRLLGALEALNGVLMIGLCTGASFAVVSELMQRAWKDRERLFSNEKNH